MPIHRSYYDAFDAPVRVVLPCTGERVPEDQVTFEDIEENFEGRDVLTFTCPRCGDTHKSLRLG